MNITGASIGRVAYVPECLKVANLIQHLCRIRLTEKAFPLFITYFLSSARSEYGKAYFLNVAHRTIHLACINSTKLKAFPTLIPGLGKQKEFVDVLSACDSKIAALDHEDRLLNELFRAMLEELMSWRLAAGALVEAKS